MTTATPRPQLRDHDQLLGPATTGLTDTNRIALAALIVSLDAGITPSRCKLWLNSRRPETITLTRNGPSWKRLVSAARARRAASSSAGAGQALATQTSRRLVAHLLGHVPSGMTGRTTASGRTALAHVALDVLRDVTDKSWDSALVSHTRLGVRMGVTRLTARAGIKTATEQGWLREVKKLKGGGTRMRLGRVIGPVAQARAWTHADLIEELAEVATGELLAVEASLSAQLVWHGSHPVWGYHPDLGRMSWLVAVADAEGVDPVERFGISARTVQTHRRLLQATGIVTGDTAGPVDVLSALRVEGEASGALDRARDAELARREAAEERRQAVEAARAERTTARETVDAALDRAGAGKPGRRGMVRVPGPELDRESAGRWAAAVSRTLAQSDHEVEPVAVRRELARRLTRAGYDEETADRVAGRISPELDHQAAA